MGPRHLDPSSPVVATVVSSLVFSQIAGGSRTGRCFTVAVSSAGVGSLSCYLNHGYLHY